MVFSKYFRSNGLTLITISVKCLLEKAAKRSCTSRLQAAVRGELRAEPDEGRAVAAAAAAAEEGRRRRQEEEAARLRGGRGGRGGAVRASPPRGLQVLLPLLHLLQTGTADRVLALDTDRLSGL